MLKDTILISALLIAIYFAGSKPKHITEIVTETVYVTKDTCDTDSDFINAIGHIETLNTDSLIGDSGRAFGRYQIHTVIHTHKNTVNILI